jgi:hypothetical protein
MNSHIPDVDLILTYKETINEHSRYIPPLGRKKQRVTQRAQRASRPIIYTPEMIEEYKRERGLK